MFVHRYNAWLFAFYLWYARALETNRSIDDENGDSVTGAKPVYAGSWNYGPACPGCFVQPDINNTFDHSWHDTTASPTDLAPKNVTFSFTGTSLWIYCVIPNYVQYATTFTNLSFELDGRTVATYSHLPGQSSAFQYNVTVFSATSLDNVEHTMVITPRRDVNSSLLLFDWAMYTFDSAESLSPGPSSTGFPSFSRSSSGTDGSSTMSATSSGSHRSQITPSLPQSSSIDNVHTARAHVPAIIGGVVAGTSTLLSILLVVVWLRRRRRTKMDRIAETRLALVSEMNNATQVNPYTIQRMTVSPIVDRDSTTFSSLETDFAANLSSGPSNVITPSSTAQSMFPSNRPRRERRSRRHKASTRRAELTRQMEIIERHVADLQERRHTAAARLWSGMSSRHETTDGSTEHSTSHTRTTTDVRRTFYELELSRRIEALQLEVERLRLEATTVLDDPPPAYEWDYDEAS